LKKNRSCKDKAGRSKIKKPMEKSLIIEKSEKLIAYSDAKTNNKNSFLPRIWVLNESDLRGTIRQEGEQTRKARKVNMILKKKRETNKSASGPI